MNSLFVTFLFLATTAHADFFQPRFDPRYPNSFQPNWFFSAPALYPVRKRSNRSSHYSSQLAAYAGYTATEPSYPNLLGGQSDSYQPNYFGVGRGQNFTPSPQYYFKPTANFSPRLDRQSRPQGSGGYCAPVVFDCETRIAVGTRARSFLLTRADC